MFHHDHSPADVLTRNQHRPAKVVITTVRRPTVRRRLAVRGKTKPSFAVRWREKSGRSIAVGLLLTIPLGCSDTDAPAVVAGSTTAAVEVDSNVDQAVASTVEERVGGSPVLPDVTLKLMVSGIEQDRGSVRVAVFRESDGFPNHEFAEFTQSFAISTSVREGAARQFVLNPIPPGSYAIAVYHDVDDNDNLNKALLGYPTEPYGFSNDARATLGPPAFQSALLTVSADHSETSITVK